MCFVLTDNNHVYNRGWLGHLPFFRVNTHDNSCQFHQLYSNQDQVSMPNMPKGELFIVTMYLSSYLIIQVFFVLCFCYFFILHINRLRGMLATFFCSRNWCSKWPPLHGYGSMGSKNATNKSIRQHIILAYVYKIVYIYIAMNINSILMNISWSLPVFHPFSHHCHWPWRPWSPPGKRRSHRKPVLIKEEKSRGDLAGFR